MQFRLNDDGVAYGWYMFVIFILGAALVLAAMAVMMNGFVDYTNSAIQDGEMSVQTKSAIQWNLNAFWWLPVFTIIGVFIWMIVRALEQKRLGA